MSDAIAGKLAGDMNGSTQFELDVRFHPAAAPESYGTEFGFRSGEKGTHTSRTMMLAELSSLLVTVPENGGREEYRAAIIDGNCLGKTTAATRRLTNQRLAELYSLDKNVPIFRVMRGLWGKDESSHALLALLTCLARDPLLLATAPSIISLPPGSEFQRTLMREALSSYVTSRLNESILDKVVRNAASSWTQSAHLEGRTFKFRRLVSATPASVAFALYLGYCAGFRGAELFSTGWIKVLDCSVASARAHALDAKRLGMIDLRLAGDVVELGLERLDPWKGRV